MTKKNKKKARMLQFSDSAAQKQNICSQQTRSMGSQYANNAFATRAPLRTPQRSPIVP